MKRWVPIFLLLSLLLTGCGGNTKDYEAEILRLREENNSLQAQVESLQDQLNQLKNTRLESWTLEARGAGEGEPASIVFTARPSAHEEGQKAELVVSRQGQAGPEELPIPIGGDPGLFLPLPGHHQLRLLGWGALPGQPDPASPGWLRLLLRPDLRRGDYGPDGSDHSG